MKRLLEEKVPSVSVDGRWDVCWYLQLCAGLDWAAGLGWAEPAGGWAGGAGGGGRGVYQIDFARERLVVFCTWSCVCLESCGSCSGLDGWVNEVAMDRLMNKLSNGRMDE